MVKRFLKVTENSCVLDQLCLHFRSNLLEEWELFNHKVKVIQESLFNILSDIVVQSWLNVERLVGLLNLLDPHVQRVKFLLNEVVEVVRGVEDSVNGTHQEGEEGQTQKL